MSHLTIIEWGWARYEELSSPKFTVINQPKQKAEVDNGKLRAW
jgi:hypothetical protein